MSALACLTGSASRAQAFFETVFERRPALYQGAAPAQLVDFKSFDQFFANCGLPAPFIRVVKDHVDVYFGDMAVTGAPIRSMSSAKP